MIKRIPTIYNNEVLFGFGGRRNEKDAFEFSGLKLDVEIGFNMMGK